MMLQVLHVSEFEHYHKYHGLSFIMGLHTLCDTFRGGGEMCVSKLWSLQCLKTKEFNKKLNLD